MNFLTPLVLEKLCHCMGVHKHRALPTPKQAVLSTSIRKTSVWRWQGASFGDRIGNVLRCPDRQAASHLPLYSYSWQTTVSDSAGAPPLRSHSLTVTTTDQISWEQCMEGRPLSLSRATWRAVLSVWGPTYAGTDQLVGMRPSGLLVLGAPHRAPCRCSPRQWSWSWGGGYHSPWMEQG